MCIVWSRNEQFPVALMVTMGLPFGASVGCRAKDWMIGGSEENASTVLRVSCLCLLTTTSGFLHTIY
jgi:hypothetical protein